MAIIAETAPPAGALTNAADERVDHAFICDYVSNGAKVLDVGCEDGTLLSRLLKERAVDGRGIEISQRRVNECVARGLFVVQGDADADLKNYPDDAFDYVILSQTIQATKKPKEVVSELLRIGRKDAPVEEAPKAEAPEEAAAVEAEAAFRSRGRRLEAVENLTLTNMFASQAVFVLCR